MIGWCSNCKHAHTAMVVRNYSSGPGDEKVFDGSGWAKCIVCACGWQVSIPRFADRNCKSNHLGAEWSGRCDDRSLRAVILHRARDAHFFPNCHSDYDDIELGKRELRELFEEALAAGVARGFSSDLERLGQIQNEETRAEHRATGGSPYNPEYCTKKKLCSTCARIEAGKNRWWPPEEER